LRASGKRVGLVRPRLLRPFPEKKLSGVLANKKGVCVIDQNLSTGKGGVLHTEIASALYGQNGSVPVLTCFIGGLGGRDITEEEFFEMIQITAVAAKSGIAPPPRLLYKEDELRQMRKLQAVAHVERTELGEMQ
ncbi:MAG: pyruvate synthase, partial [Candidatus Dadabacteria bacterium]|nr:pyruvate synthase [Candidatus Dadabacteria bacterium]NIS09393.1 pyruvate synthase [Candidatus Dadabacteria bacterium]NIY22633.1 pyruvate synthase [Candidatus Dadabacteria bacterium]